VHADEQAIRELVQTWLRASAAGDLEQVLTLMSDDVVFLAPGQKPFGKEAFAAASRASHGKVRIDARGEVQEVHVAGDLAFCRTRLRVTVAPTQGGETKRLAGHTLSVLRRQPDGRWVLARDANLLTAEAKQRTVQAAVPVFQVASVARSVAWYRDVLGFTADPVGPPDEPVFAILRRDGVELMLQKACPGATPARPATTEQGWNVYVRVADVRAVRAAVLAHLPGVTPIVAREYGCREFTVTDPDGHVLVFGECG
jgi:uncharacterized protein (TIGR02246 family)